MIELETTRSEQDRRRHDVPGIGTLRLPAWRLRSATAQTADGRSLSFSARGMLRLRAEATGPDGMPVGSLQPVGMRTAEVHWGSDVTELRMRPWGSRGELRRAGELVLDVQPRWSGRRLVTIRLDPDARLEPGLVLFVTWLVLLERTRRQAAAG